MSEEGLPMWLSICEPMNDSLYWRGAVANPEAWKDHPHLAVDINPPWYYCRPCMDAGANDLRTRLSLGAKFCPNCGNKIEWTDPPTITESASSRQSAEEEAN